LSFMTAMELRKVETLYMGFFLVFEGIEGCGKTTQIKMLGDYCKQKGLPCIVTREPGGTPIGEEIRKIFLHSDNVEITHLTELLLITASRVQHLKQVIQPALDNNSIVMCDRFFGATLAYQGYAGDIPLELINKSHELFLENIKPDITLLMDCPVEIGIKRSRERNVLDGIEKEEGRFEDKVLAFHHEVRKGYLAIAEADGESVKVVDASQSIEKIHSDICMLFENRIKEMGYAV